MISDLSKLHVFYKLTIVVSANHSIIKGAVSAPWDTVISREWPRPLSLIEEH